MNMQRKARVFQRKGGKCEFRQLKACRDVPSEHSFGINLNKMGINIL